MCRIPLFKVLQDKKVRITYYINTDDNYFSIKGENYSKFWPYLQANIQNCFLFKIVKQVQLLQICQNIQNKIATD